MRRVLASCLVLPYLCFGIMKYCVVQEQTQSTLGGSKKDNDVRRQEILGEGASSLASALCDVCSANAANMLRSPMACDVIVEVAQAGSSGVPCLHLHFALLFSPIGDCCSITIAFTLHLDIVRQPAYLDTMASTQNICKHAQIQGLCWCCRDFFGCIM